MIRSILKRFAPSSPEFKRKFGRFYLQVSTASSRLYLKQKGPLKILVDNSVLGHAITHETAWIPTGTSKWGSHDIETGHSARIPVYSPDNKSEIYKEIQYLPGIAKLAKEKYIELFQSAELKAESWRQPIGRYIGYGSFDLNLFANINISTVDGYYFDLTNPKLAQKTRLKNAKDEPYATLVKILGEKNDQDAWHIHTAHHHNMFCFLCIDRKLLNMISQAKKRKNFPALKCEVMSPSMLGKYIRLNPVHPSLISYEDFEKCFFIHSKLSWPNKKRNRPKKANEKQSSSDKNN